MGAKGTRTPLHWDPDEHSFLGVLEGMKEVALIPPTETSKLSAFRRAPKWDTQWFTRYVEWGGLDVGAPGYFNELHARGVRHWRVELHAGQMLYIPPFWWHSVLNIEPGVGFDFHFTTVQGLFLSVLPELALANAVWAAVTFLSVLLVAELLP